MTQDQIDAVYPLNYTVVKGDWIAKIARKYPIECLSLQERVETIIESNASFLLPRSGLNSLDELLVGGDFILPGDILLIPGYLCPTKEEENYDPEVLAEYSLCSNIDGIIGVLQIIQYPNEFSLSVISTLKNFPPEYVKEYTYGANAEYSSNYKYVAEQYLKNDLNPDLIEINLAGDLELCSKIPYLIKGKIVGGSDSKNGKQSGGTPIQGVKIEDTNGSKTSTDVNGEYEIKGTYEDPNSSGNVENIIEKELAEADVIDMSKAQSREATLTPPIYPTQDLKTIEVVDEEEKIKKRKNRKKRLKRKLGWDISWPSFSLNLNLRNREWERSKKLFKRQFDYETEGDELLIKESKIKNNKSKKEKTPKEIRDKKLKERKIKVKKEKEAKEKVEKVPKQKDPKDKSKKPKKVKKQKPPTIICGKTGWCKRELPLIGFNGFPKLTLGLISLDIFNPNFPKLQRPQFTIPDFELKALTLPKINLHMVIQIALNKLISKIKKNLIPSIGLLLAKFNICDIPKALALLALGVRFVDLGVSCPTDPEEMKRLIKKRNRLTKALNNIFKFLGKIRVTIDTANKLLTVADILLIAAQIFTFIPSTTFTPIPSASSNVVELFKRQLKKYKTLIPGILSVLAILITLLAKVLQYLSLLDNAISTCSNLNKNNNENFSNLLIENELLLATFQQSKQGEPVVTNVNGFNMRVITVDSIEIDGTKRRQAIASNKAGVIMLRGEPSFSSNDQILIDELVYYIQTNDLKAD